MTSDELPHRLVAVLVLVLTLIGAGTPLVTGHVTTSPPTQSGEDVASALGGLPVHEYNTPPSPNATEYAKLWSNDREGIDREANATLAASDLTWSNPPSIASKWNSKVLNRVSTNNITTYRIGNTTDSSLSVNKSNVSKWSVAPTDASFKQGTVIHDAYVEVHSVTPSIRYHLPSKTTTVTRPSGTIRVLTDLGVTTQNGSISPKSVSVDNVTVTDESDGARLAHAGKSGTGAVTVDYSGFDAGHRGMKVAANLSVTYSGNATNTTTETIHVTDSVNMVSYSPKEANASVKTFPNNTSAVSVNAGTPFWDHINMSGSRSVKNVWRYYTVSDSGRVIVAKNGTDTARQGTARAAQVNAYIAHQKPRFVENNESDGSDGGSVSVSGEGESAPSLGSNINLNGPRENSSVQVSSKVDLHTDGVPARSVSIGSGISNETRDIPVKRGTNTYKEAHLSATILGNGSKNGTKKVLVNLTDDETGRGIDTLGTGSGGSVSINGQTVETNASGMAVVDIPTGHSVDASYKPGDRPGNKRYMAVKSNSVTVQQPGDKVGLSDLFQWFNDFTPLLVSGAIVVFGLKKLGIVHSMRPWEWGR